LNSSILNSTAGEDFVTQLSKSHQFKLQPVDLAKLLKIRTAKNGRRQARLLEQMGLPLEENTVRPKKIFLSRRSRPAKERSDSVIEITGIYMSFFIRLFNRIRVRRTYFPI
jgi:hypothetical protein